MTNSRNFAGQIFQNSGMTVKGAYLDIVFHGADPGCVGRGCPEKISCVILDFLCIHPFRDGNGRMSRLLSLLLLYKNGFEAGKYISFEEQINLRKGNYYDALLQSSTGWHENQNDYSAYIMEFLTTLYACYKELDKRFAVVGSKRVTKQARVEATVLNSLTPVSKSDIGKILPDVSTTTIEAVLGQMVRSGQIRKIGSGRNTRYIRTGI